MADMDQKETSLEENKEAENLENSSDLEQSDEDGIEEGGSPAKSKKKLIIMVAFVVLISVGAIGYTLMKKKKEAEEIAKVNQEQQLSSSKNDPIFHDMDEMIINLNTEGKGVSFMKLKVTLEVANKNTLEETKKMMPKISDVFQMYLRELRPSDMNGSVGLYRLKEELLLRINKIIYPSQVNDILFKEVLVQ